MQMFGRVGTNPLVGGQSAEAVGDWWNYPQRRDHQDGYDRSYFRVGDVDIYQKQARFDVNPSRTMRREIEVKVDSGVYKIQVFRQSYGTASHCYVVGSNGVQLRLERDNLSNEFNAYGQSRSVVFRAFPPQAIEVFKKLLIDLPGE